ncbi:MAG: T9SS type A sorting domain-containing protein [Phycisphaerae bacterium]|nr:T9SS type A sorting domain-containing protein [Saprospiraceae bacterium]
MTHSLILAKIMRRKGDLFSKIHRLVMKIQLFLVLGLSFHCSFLLAQVPQWQHIPGPDGGHIENFDLDGTALYALTQSGIYRSEDEGYHWELLPQSLANTRYMYQLRVEKGVFYAINKNGALVRSDDQGASWKPVLQKPFPFNFEEEHLQQLFVKGDTILVGSLFTIYRSTNRGETWTTTADLAPASFVSIFEFKNEIFAAQDRYIYRSSNGGMSWESVFSNAVGFASVTATDSFLLAFYDDRTRLVRSTDGLRSWKAIDTDTILQHFEGDDIDGYYPFTWVCGSGSELYYFQNKSTNFLCPIRYCYSLDMGNTWHGGNNRNEVLIAGAINDGINFGNHIVLGCDLIQHSVDSAQTFFPNQEGLGCAVIRHVIHQHNSVFSTTDWEHDHYSRDLGATWEQFPLSSYWEDKCYSSVWFTNTDERLFRFQIDAHYSEVSHSMDGGQTWSAFGPEYPYRNFVTNHGFWYIKLVETPSGDINKVWKFADQDTASKEIQLVNFDINEHYSFSFIGLGDRFGIKAKDDFYIFDEAGYLIQKLPPTPCISISDPNPTRLYFANNTYYNFCSHHCFILPPNAADWQEIYPQDWTTGIPLYHNRMTFAAEHDGVLWVGLEGKGLFYATDNTGRFYPALPQMPYPYPTAISFYENELWVGTDGGGIWTYPVPKTLSYPAKNTVFKVFPNPSNGALNLQSDAFVKEDLSFSILDAAGRRIEKKVLSPGQYWSLDFPGLPKGLYFLQMRTESGVFGLKWVVEN